MAVNFSKNNIFLHAVVQDHLDLSMVYENVSYYIVESNSTCNNSQFDI